MGGWNARAGTLSGVDIADGAARESMDTVLVKEFRISLRPRLKQVWK